MDFIKVSVGDTARYRKSSLSGLDGLRSGGDTGYAFNSSNALWHSLVHSKALFRILKNGKHLSVARETNLLSAATLPFRLYTSLTFFEGLISRIAWILSRLASTPHWDTIKPRNFLDDTSNTHLLGLSFILQRRRVSKVFLRSFR